MNHVFTSFLRRWLSATLVGVGLPTALVIAQPTLVSRSPAANRVNATPAAPVQVTFSAAMTAATASATAVKVSSVQRGYLSTAGAYSGGGTATPQLAPALSFWPGEQVSVTVTTAARRLSDNVPIAAPYVYQFRAAAAAAPGTFAVAPQVSTGTGSPRGQAAADFNQDGKLDFAVAYYNLNQAQVFLGNGSGGFTAGVSYATGTGPVAMVTADIDNDGDADLLTVNRVTNSVTVAKNGGSPGYAFTVSSTLALGAGSLPQNLDMGDLDGDGDIDLVVTRLAANRISVYLNNGTGTFTAGTALVIVRPYGVRLADLDNDGDLDLAATQRAYLGSPAVADKVFLRLNSGSATFTTLPDLTVGSEPYDVQAADLDGDLDNDLLVTNTVNNTVAVRLNNGAGSFSGTQDVGVGQAPSAVAMADIDGDGDLDFATANVLTISIRHNNGAGVFGGTMEVPTYDDPFTILAGDVDNDLDVDFLVNNTTTNSESILINRTLTDTTISVTQPLIGSYRHVTITGTGKVTLGAALGVLGTCHVQNGGELDPGRFILCSSGALQVDAGAILHCSHAVGLSASGLSGPVQLAGARALSDDASYVYDATAGAQVTGAGLPATVRNLTASAPTGLTLSQPLSVRRMLTLTAATNLQLAAHDLTLLSNVNHTAMLVKTGAGVLQYGGAGRAVVQRYIQPATAYTGAAYRHYSPPVQGATVASLDVAGSFSARVGTRFNALPTPLTWVANSFPNVFDYDESRITATYASFDTGWHCPPTRTALLTATRGYTVHIRAGARVTMRGQLHTGAQPTGALGYGATVHNGWHLLGNPYAAPLDWNVVRTTLGAIPSGMDDAISLFEPTGTGAYDGSYLTYVNGLGTLPGGLIPMMQGFFVHCSAPVPGGFTFQEAFRATTYTNPNFARPVADPRPVVQLALDGPVGATDQLVVYWEAGATPAVDARFDARKLTSTGRAPSLAALAPDGTRLSIQGLPPLSATTPTMLVPLTLRAGITGTCTLRLAAARNLPAGCQVWLEDRLTGQRLSLQVGTGGYTFTAASAGWLAAGRFWLRVGAPARPTELEAVYRPAPQPLLAWPNPATIGEALQVSGLDEGAGSVTLTLRDALEQTARIARVAAGQPAVVPTAGLRAGLYLLTVEAADQPPRTVRVWLQ